MKELKSSDEYSKAACTWAPNCESFSRIQFVESLICVINQGLYQIQVKLGQGAYGAAYLATRRTINTTISVVFKSLYLEDTEDFDREQSILERLHGVANIPKLIDSTDISEIGSRPIKCGIIVMEAIEGAMDVKKYVYKHADKINPDEFLREFLIQTSLALMKISQEDVTHHDVKPENILVQELKFAHDKIGHKFVLIDFGLAMTSGNLKGRESPVSGTPHYMDPITVKFEKNRDFTDMTKIKTFMECADIYSLAWSAVEIYGQICKTEQTIMSIGDCELIQNWQKIRPRGINLDGMAGYVNQIVGARSNYFENKIAPKLAKSRAWNSQTRFEKILTMLGRSICRVPGNSKRTRDFEYIFSSPFVCQTWKDFYMEAIEL